MKPQDFIKEGHIVDDAHAMHQDHEVQMAREECYHAAKTAIELHQLLKGVDEMQGLDGWVSEKITIAYDYLKTVYEYLDYELRTKGIEMPPVAFAESFGKVMGEETKANGPWDQVDPRIDTPMGKKTFPTKVPDPVKKKPTTPFGTNKNMEEDQDPCWDNYKMVGTKKKGGKTVPNCVPKESVDEALDRELDALMEFAGGMGAGSVATAPGVGQGSKVGSLFGGSYSPAKSPFKKKTAKKESVIKR